MKIRSFSFLPFILSTSFLLTACGGGNNSSNNTTQSSDLIALSPSNAEEASSAVLESTDSATSTGSTSIILSAVTESETPSIELETFLLNYLNTLPLTILQPDTNNIIVGVAFGPTTLNCNDPSLGGISGQITVSGNINSSLNLTAGDTINSTFHNCQIEPGLIADGQLDIRFNSVSGNTDFTTPPYSANMTLGMDNFSVTQNLENFFADGDMTLFIEEDLNNILTLNVSGQRLLVSDGANTSETLFNYVISEIVDLDSNTFTTDIQGTLDNDILGGSVIFETTTPFTGTVGQYPSAGHLLLLGSNNSSAEVTALNSASININIDADGDNTYESTLNTNWSQTLPNGLNSLGVNYDGATLPVATPVNN